MISEQRPRRMPSSAKIKDSEFEEALGARRRSPTSLGSYAD
jgi:hypothetical protein